MPKATKSLKQRRYDAMNQRCKLKYFKSKGIKPPSSMILDEQELIEAYDYISRFLADVKIVEKYVDESFQKQLKIIKDVYPLLYQKAKLVFCDIEKQVGSIHSIESTSANSSTIVSSVTDSN